MPESRRRVLLVSSQPIQNDVTIRLLSEQPDLEVLTAYCSLADKKMWKDAEHLNKGAFDTPVLQGYRWTSPANYSPAPGLGKSYGLINPGLIRLAAKADCCVVFGHSYVSFWLAILTAKLFGKPLLLTTDATDIESAGGAGLKSRLKRKVLPFLYNRVADLVLVPSTASRNFLLSVGVAGGRVVVTPYVVDNDRIAATAAAADRSRLRGKWGIPVAAPVAVFCAKFIARKRPHDAIRAFARAGVPGSFLLMVGDGPLADSLRQETAQLGLGERVRFTGLVKYSFLPEVYAAADALVFTSEREPYGLPVNEAMVCGIPAIISDRVGAGLDLVREGETGYTYPCGDIDALSAVLRASLSEPALLKKMGAAAQVRMRTWSPRDNAEATARAIRSVITAREKS